MMTWLKKFLARRRHGASAFICAAAPLRGHAFLSRPPFRWSYSANTAGNTAASGAAALRRVSETSRRNAFQRTARDRHRASRDAARFRATANQKW
jgi:hypothetical protein